MPVDPIPEGAQIVTPYLLVAEPKDDLEQRRRIEEWARQDDSPWS